MENGADHQVFISSPFTPAKKARFALMVPILDGKFMMFQAWQYESGAAKLAKAFHSSTTHRPGIACFVRQLHWKAVVEDGRQLSLESKGQLSL